MYNFLPDIVLLCAILHTYQWSLLARKVLWGKFLAGYNDTLGLQWYITRQNFNVKTKTKKLERYKSLRILRQAEKRIDTS